MGNSIEEAIKQLKLILKVRKEQKEIIECAGGSCMNCNPDIQALTKSIDILSDYKRVLEMNKILLKENEQLKNDIKNMYNEEVIISIIEDNFNLCRNEVLELLESEEK